MIAIRRSRELRYEGLHRKRVRDIGDRSKPADARMRRRFRILDAQVIDLVGQVDEAHAHLERCFVLRIGAECRGDTGRNAPMHPGDDFALCIQARFQMLDRDRMKEVVVEIVFASPDDLDRLAAHLAGQKRRLDGKVGFGLSSEAAAEQSRREP